MRLLIALLCLLTTWSAARAERASFTFLRTVNVAELNSILTTEREKFLEDAKAGDGYQLPPASVATNDVDLYVVRYYSYRPEFSGKSPVLVSGLLALPRLANRGDVPLISYQHGTVFGKYEVPSYAFKSSNPDGYKHYDNAYETRFMVALFAGNGYALMAADYFGMGDNSRSNEAYMMKRSTAQVNFDLYLDVHKYLASRSIGVSRFLLGGWSQGGLNTTGFLELLEQRAAPVRAAFTAAAPNDPYAALNGVFYHPRDLDAPWINTILALTIFSCENYMGPKGLAMATIDPNYFTGFKTIYERTSYPAGLNGLLGSWYGTPILKYLRPEFRDPSYLASSAYGKCLAANETYRQEFKTALRMFYGSRDEVIRMRTGILAAEYQETLVDTPDATSSNKITPVLVKGGDHRLTFITAAPAAKAWMDNLP